MLRFALRAAYRRAAHLWFALWKFPAARFEPWILWKGKGGFSISTGVFVSSGTVLSSPRGARLELREGAWIGPDCELAAGEHIEVGERTSLQSRTQLHGDVTLGAGCLGAANLYISSGWHAFDRSPALPIRVQDFHKSHASHGERSRPVRVGDDCWIGINVVITPGVTVGRGCIIGANSVVTRDLSPYTIAAGSPARELGKRLEFVPPRSVDAASDADLPYFYSGLQQLGASQDSDSAPARVRGGWPVRENFTIALAAADGDTVSLRVDCVIVGRLTHGQTTREVSLGQQTLTFHAQPDSTGFLAFVWQPYSRGPLAGLVVNHAVAQSGSDDKMFDS